MTERHKYTHHVDDLESDGCFECGQPEKSEIHITDESKCPCCGFPQCGHDHSERPVAPAPTASAVPTHVISTTPYPSLTYSATPTTREELMSDKVRTYSTDDPSAREWTFDLDVHYHEAHYDEQALTRKCSACNRDLLDEIHIRGSEGDNDARRRMAEAYASSKLRGVPSSAKDWLENDEKDALRIQLSHEHDCPTYGHEETIELLEAYASSQSEKLAGVGQQAAEEIVELGESRTAINGGYSDIVCPHKDEISAIIDRVIAGRVKP